MKTRSVDDIRNYWQLKLLPLLVPDTRLSLLSSQEWKEEDDIELLSAILYQDVIKPTEIDFSDIDNGRSPSDNQGRWVILLKGLGGIFPGMQVNASQMASKMISDIKTKHERYVPWVNPTGASSRTGKNQFINILDYFRKHFK